MEREANPNPWEAWRFKLIDVVPHEHAFGESTRVLRDDGKLQRTLHPNFKLELFRDEAEGYHLNLRTGTPVWFVMWRLAEDDPSAARPEIVTLSYNEAGRLLDAQEHVDNVPLQGELRDWLGAFTEAHYKPEVKQRRRPKSFQRPEDRQ